MGLRSEKVQRQMEREISRILHEDLKDPRIGFATVTRITLTADLRYARVYFSIYGDESTQQAGLKGIKSAAGYIRKLVGERLKLKYVPELSFTLDRSIEYSIRLEETFKKLEDERKDHQG